MLGGNQARQNGQFEEEETKIVTNIISKYDVVINIGANIGYYFSIALSQEKNVVAFEPLNLNVQHLLQNIKFNNRESNIEVYPILPTNKVGVIEIYGSGTGASLFMG